MKKKDNNNCKKVECIHGKCEASHLFALRVTIATSLDFRYRIMLEHSQYFGILRIQLCSLYRRTPH